MTTFAYYLDLLLVERTKNLNKESDQLALYCLGKVGKINCLIKFYDRGWGVSDCFKRERK